MTFGHPIKNYIYSVDFIDNLQVETSIKSIVAKTGSSYQVLIPYQALSNIVSVRHKGEILNVDQENNIENEALLFECSAS